MTHNILNVISLIFLISIQINANFLGTRSSTSKLIEKLQNPKFVKLNGFNPILMSTIELKLKSMGKLNEVLELLDQLNKDLENEQEEADTDYDNQNAVWSSSISDLETEISDLETQILYDEQRILDLKAELNTLNEQLIAYQEQKETFTNKRASLVEARENDISAYEKRVSDQTAIVDALQDILDLLQNENTAGNLAEIKNTVRTNLRKFKEKAGPYATLVGLTLTFDPEVISNIIAKLQKIQTSTQASIADDKAQEDKAEIDYQLFLDTIDGTLASIEENIINTQKSIATDTVDLNEKEEAFEAEKNLLESYNSQKTDLEKARDVYNAAYKKDTEERTSEINTVVAAQEILISNQGSIEQAESSST